MKAKTINLLLYEGGLDGVLSIEDSGWNSGELYSVPRESIDDLFKTDACNKFGVYLLLSRERVYIGQASDLARRLSQHRIGKDWWNSAVILTTKDDSFDHADIDFLESALIELATEKGRLDCDNKKKGNAPKVSKYRKVRLCQYLEEALFLMRFIGIKVFSDAPKKDRDGIPVVDTLDTRTQLALGRRAKGEALNYLKEHGVDVVRPTTYSVLQANGDTFWMNPQVKRIESDWGIVLNDNQSHELLVLSVPACSLSMRDDGTSGLLARSDKPQLLDLKIDRETLTDRNSGVDFSSFVVTRLRY